MTSPETPPSGATRVSSDIRVGASIGLLGLFLLALALFLPGQPPQSDDPAAMLAERLADDRGSVLAATVLAGFSLFGLLWFYAAVRTYLVRNRLAQETTATAGFAGGVAGVLLATIGFAVYGSYLFLALEVGSEAQVRAATDLANFCFGLARFGFALAIVAWLIAGASSGVLSRGLILFGGAAAILMIAGAAALVATDGFFQFAGAFDLVSIAPAMVWFACLAVSMLRGERE